MISTKNAEPVLAKWLGGKDPTGFVPKELIGKAEAKYEYSWGRQKLV